MKKLILVLSFFILFSQLFAIPVSEFKFSGNKKTQSDWLEKTLSHFYGKEADETTLHEIETSLHSQGLFEEIIITPDEENPGIISIQLKEKISFIPVPFLMFSNDYWLAGGAVLNMNAFGNKTLLMAGGFFSNKTFSGVFAISKPAASIKDTGWSFAAGANRSTTKLTDLYNQPYTEFKSTGFNLGGNLSNKLTPFTSVSGGLSASFSYYSKTPDYELILDSKKSLDLKGSALLSHGTSDWNGLFLNNKSVSLGASGGYDFFSQEFSGKIHSSFTFQQALFERLRLNTDISGSYGFNLPLTGWSGGGSASVMILPSGFVSPVLAGGSAGLEFAVKKFTIGLFTIYSNYQAVYFKNLNEEFLFCQGVSGGVRLYLSKIAVPAFAFGLGKNITTDSWHYTMSLGVSF